MFPENGAGFGTELKRHKESFITDVVFLLQVFPIDGLFVQRQIHLFPVMKIKVVEILNNDYCSMLTLVDSHVLQ